VLPPRVPGLVKGKDVALSNMMPGDNSGADPEECPDSCPSMCEYADQEIVDRGDGEGLSCPNGHSSHECDGHPPYEPDYWD
jgi:hypothetical protein